MFLSGTADNPVLKLASSGSVGLSMDSTGVTLSGTLTGESDWILIGNMTISGTLETTGRASFLNNVGIGTSSPEEDLHIAKAGSAIISLEDTSSTYHPWIAHDDNIFAIQTRDASATFKSNDYLIYEGASGSTDHQWRIENSPAMHLDSTGLGIGTTSPNSSALLDVSSTTKGFLPPRMTTTQRDAISSPAAGLTIFNTTTTKIETYDGSTWQAHW